ncbi:MAG: hypothetical protein FWF86_04980 [Clostridia bacterium]|nr:hypothetical protein [Clostridia bacterium]
MLELCIGVQPAPGQKRVFQANRGGFAKGGPDVVIIISFQITAVNDAEDLILMLLPIGFRELRGNVTELMFQPYRAGDTVPAFQGGRGGGFIAFVHLPLEGCSGLFPSAGVRDIEHIPQLGVAAIRVNEGYALGTATDIAAHGLVPEGIVRAGGRIGPLGVDHKLFKVGIFIEPCGSGEKPRPFLATACNLLCRLNRHLLVGLCCAWHLSASFHDLGEYGGVI